MPSVCSVRSVDFPTRNRSPTGSRHILSGISCGNSVCTRSGFLKSLAIFASSLFVDIPTFTVNPSSRRISSLMRAADSTGGPKSFSVPVMSTKHSSILHCSILSEYRSRIAMNALEYSLYIPWREGTITRLGHFLSASVIGSPVCTLYFFAGMDFASMIPRRLERSPPTADGISRRSAVISGNCSGCFSRSTASHDRKALLTST